MIRILKKSGLMLLAITAMGLVWASDVNAGYNADGKPGEYNYEEDGLPSVRATTIIMQNGGNYDVSKYDGATYLRCSSSGTYYLTGTTDKTMLVIESHPGDDIQIILNGVSMTATWRCPGAAANARSAVEITGNGGKVTFVSNENTKNYFESKGGRNAIRKDTTDVELVFDGRGTITAKADSSGIKTCAIGCYMYKTFGNVEFKGGEINAYGSCGTGGGGAAIGADMYAAVNGLTFSGAKVNAYSGSASAACIGTCSAYLFEIITDNDRLPTDCKNINISGGVIECHQKDDTSFVYGGAGIGGGWGNSVDGIHITGGTVYAYGAGEAAGIGGGCEGDGLNITIDGGTIYAQGHCAGIGAGRASGPIANNNKIRFGDTQVTINGGDVTAVGGLSAGNGKGSGCGIGGGKEKFYDWDYSHSIISTRSHIVINGGKVKAYGRNCAAIGASSSGYIHYVSIKGGDVYAQTTPDAACIGSLKSGDDSNCRIVYIEGGVVETAEKAEKSEEGKTIGTIGGVNAKKPGDERDGQVVVSGGNLKAKMARGTAYNHDTNGIAVECKEVAIGTFGLGIDRDQKQGITALVTKNNSSYTINGMKTFGVRHDKDPALYVWLPADDQVISVTMDKTMFNKGPAGENETIFKNLAPTSMTSTTLYPKFWFFFDDNADVRDTSKDCAWAYIGDTTVSEMKKAGTAENPAVGYYVDKERTKVLLGGDGYLQTTVKSASRFGNYTVQWTDGYGHLIIKYENSTEDPKDSQGYGISGIPLYSYYDKFTIKYQVTGTEPKNASTTASGDLTTGLIDWSDSSTAAVKIGEHVTKQFKGYLFDKWNFNKDGSGSSFSDDSDVIIRVINPDRKAEVTLYATWTPTTYTVQFNGDSPTSGSMENQELIFDQPATLNENKFTKDGWKFAGWTTSQLGGRTYCDKDEVVNISDLSGEQPLNLTLTAKWVPNTDVTILLFDDCKNITDATLKLKKGELTYSITADGSGLYRQSGMESGTWTVTAEGPGGTTYISAEENYTVPITTGGDVIVIQLVTVSANDDDHITDGGTQIKRPWSNTWSTEVKYVPEGKSVDIKTDKAKIDTGYAFDGYSHLGVPPTWDSTKKDQSITVKGQVTITGHAAPAVYHVTFNPNKGYGDRITQDYVYNEQQKLFPNTFSRVGYTFLKWNTKADGTGISFDDNALVKNLADQDGAEVTLYAQWKTIEYFIGINNARGRIIGSSYSAFYAEGTEGEEFFNSDVGEILRKYTIEDEVVIPMPTWTDNDFMGWTGTGISEPTTTLVIPKGTTGSMEFDAHWRLKQFHVVFDTDGGSAIEEEVVWVHDKAAQPADPTKNGATFLGWYADADRTTTYNFDEEVTSDRTIYAKWKGGVPKSGDSGIIITWMLLATASLGLIAKRLKNH